MRMRLWGNSAKICAAALPSGIFYLPVSWRAVVAFLQGEGVASASSATDESALHKLQSELWALDASGTVAAHYKELQVCTGAHSVATSARGLMDGAVHVACK